MARSTPPRPAPGARPIGWWINIEQGPAIVLVLGVRVNGFVRVAVRRPSRTADGHLWARVAHDDELLLVYRADLRGLRYVSPSIERVLGFPLADFAIDPDPRRFLVEEDLQAWNDAVAATTSRIMPRSSLDAVMSRKTSSSAPWRS